MRFALPGRARRRARLRLREDQCLLEALLENAGVAILAWGGDGRLTHASRRASELLGAECPLAGDPRERIAALRPRTPSGIPLVREDLPFVRALEGEAVRGVDVLVHVRGCDLLLSTLASPVYDERGRRRGVVALLEDVTERRRDEARLRQQARGGIAASPMPL
jgi:PAS domain-containing protein